MLKNAIAIIILFFVVTCLSSCADTKGTTRIDTQVGSTEQTVTGLGRYDAWAKVETKKVDAVKALAQADEKKTDLEIARAKQVTVILDTPEKIAAWNNAQATRDLGIVAKNLSVGNQDKYSEALKPMPVPTSAFAEGTEAVGNTLVKLAESPAGVASSVGYFVGSAARGAKSGTEVKASEGSTVNIHQSSAKGQSYVTGDPKLGTSESTEITEIPAEAAATVQ